MQGRAGHDLRQVRPPPELDRVDDGYPQDIAGSWQGLWADGVDAVLYQGGSKAYFFKGPDYRRFNLDIDNVDEQGSIATRG